MSLLMPFLLLASNQAIAGFDSVWIQGLPDSPATCGCSGSSCTSCDEYDLHVFFEYTSSSTGSLSVTVYVYEDDTVGDDLVFSGSATFSISSGTSSYCGNCADVEIGYYTCDDSGCAGEFYASAASSSDSETSSLYTTVPRDDVDLKRQ